MHTELMFKSLEYPDAGFLCLQKLKTFSVMWPTCHGLTPHKMADPILHEV